MSFKSQKEIWEFLISGGKIQYYQWEEGYLELDKSGNIVNERGSPYSGGVNYPNNWDAYIESGVKNKL